MPHPKGKIKVEYKLAKGKLTAKIELPKDMSGTWKYKGVEIDLNEGVNMISQAI
jgi:hypothetical protein